MLYFSASSAMSLIMSMDFLIRFFLMTRRILFCCNDSREMLSGRSSESTTPLMNDSHSGMISSQLSMMNTRRTYNLMLLNFFFVLPPSNMSNGARFGMNKTARNSSWPSTEKCFTARCSSQSLDKAL